MEHAERMELAEAFAKKAVEKYGKNITMVAVAGNTAKGTDKEFSDVDMIIATKRPIRTPYKFIYKDTIPEPFYVTETQAKEIAADPTGDYDWITWSMLFYTAKPIYGSDRIISDYRKIASKVASAKYKKVASSKLVLMQEWLNHMHAARESGEVLNAVNCAVNFTALAMEFVVMLNESYYESHSFFALSKNFKKLPADFHDLVRKMGTSSDPEVIHETMVTLLDNCMKVAAENGIKPEKYTATGQIKV